MFLLKHLVFRKPLHFYNHNFLAYSNAARIILSVCFLDNYSCRNCHIFTFNICKFFHFRMCFKSISNFFGGLVHSIPPYIPSVFCLKITASTNGSSNPPLPSFLIKFKRVTFKCFAWTNTNI